MDRKQASRGLGLFTASCIVMVLAGLIGGMWLLFIAGLAMGGASLFRD